MSQSQLQAERTRQEMWKNVDLFLEEFYPQGCEAGMELHRADMEMTQIRGLESLIVSTRRFSEVINYIKNQAGKGTSKSRKWRQVAKTLLDQLGRLETKGAELGGDDPALVLEAKLRLVRGWGKQVVTHYLFEQARPEIEGAGHGS
jgi:hypothetical protein